MALGKVLATALALALAVLGSLSPGARAGDCKGQRQVLREAPGFVTDGAGNYSVNGNCEWLVEAPSPQHRILLDFLFLDTECTYDYLFVYDGDSPRGPLLASLSGSTRPPPIEASSGKMLLHLFSDANYNLLGFNASFRFSLCPGGCRKSPSPQPLGPCRCEPGISGRACDLHLWENQGDGRWHNVSAGDPPGSGSLAMSLPLSLVSSSQAARHSHVAVAWAGSLVLMGGELADGSLTNDVWAFSPLGRGHWELLAPPASSSSGPPGLAGHAAALVDDVWLYVSGGRTQHDLFSSGLFRFRLDSTSGGYWEQVIPAGGRPPAATGHSMVFHAPSRALLVHGGHRPSTARFSVRVNSTELFHVDRHVWTTLKGRDGLQGPRERAFHTASVLGNYMVVYGGNVHTHYQEEKCYEDGIFFYHLGCHQWVSGAELAPPGTPEGRAAPPSGRYSHVAAVLGGSVLLVAGGYSGRPRGDLMAYKVPPFVFQAPAPDYHLDYCSMYTDHSVCSRDPECSWCQGACQAAPPPGTPLGACPAASCLGLGRLLGDCQACLAFSSPTAPPRGPGTLGWCVHNESCLPRPEQARCRGEQISGTVGWWGPAPVFVTSLEACVTQSFLPGLHLLTFQQPPNTSQPDKEEVGRWVAHQEKETRRLQRPGSARLFPLPGRDHKYAVEIRGQLNGSAGPGHSELTLLWDRTGVPGGSEISFFFLEPYRSSACTSYSSCLGCLAYHGCGWCLTIATCHLRQGGAHCGDDGAGGSLLVLVPTLCPLCEEHRDCHDPFCEWHQSTNRKGDAACSRRGRGRGALKSPEECPPLCSQRLTCEDCLANSSQCAWCQSTHTCFLFAAYLARYPHGGCRGWDDSVHSEPRCRSCDGFLTCHECLQSHECGWCGNEDNPTLGRCLQGDFSGPLGGGNCSLWVGEGWGFPWPSLPRWAYARCPDVDECRLGLARCHPRATCLNTPLSYECHCQRGYQGDGISHCNRTCLEDCGHGVCSGPPDFTCVCDLGWTSDLPPPTPAPGPPAPRCSRDCGCSFHSHCRKRGPGFCDECQDWTWGEHCERCRPGSFGNATGSRGCRPCQCNGHGDPRRGHCDNLSGLCFCQDHTEGAHCQLCSPGYYGDPRAGGSCFRECGGRALLTNVSSVALGSRRFGGLLPPGGGAARAGPGLSYCVWVVSATEELQPCAPGTLCPPLTLTFSPDSSTPCTLSYVLAFDGFPRFLDTGVVQSDRSLIAAFCGQRRDRPLTVQALSGLLVLHWEANGSSSWGFNASVGSARCGSGGPGSCPVPQECVPQDGAAGAGLCRCPQGWAGPHCRMALCPENCNAHTGAGTCNQSLGVCICAEGFGGPDCATKLDGGQLVWETLMDSRLSADTASRFLHRLGHTMVDGPDATLWMFGGLGLPQGLLGNLYRYSVSERRWTQMLAGAEDGGPGPSPRSFHAAAYVPAGRGAMYMLGGLTAGGVTRDFWVLNLTTLQWRQEKVSISPQPTPQPSRWALTETAVVAPASSTPRGNRSPRLEFPQPSWVTLPGLGHSFTHLSPCPSPGLYGHSAVYHEATDSLYVFGGFRFHVELAAPSSELYSLHCPDRTWSLLAPSQGAKRDRMRNVGLGQVPGEQPGSWGFRELRKEMALWAALAGTGGFLEEISPHLKEPHPRLFHASALLGDTMVVLGGRSDPDEFSSDVLLYQVNCNAWLLPDLTRPASVGPPMEESVAHAVAAVGSRLYISGGFGGVALGRLLALTLPPDPCRLLSSPEACNQSGACTWCHGACLSGDQAHSRKCCAGLRIQGSPPLPDCPTICQQPSPAENLPLAVQQCLSPSYLPLRCMAGGCGRLLRGPESCSLGCAQATQCALCLRRPHCGWCAWGGQDGGGRCMEEGLALGWGPRQLGQDECANGHHDCNETQNCHDQPHGYECSCKTGYTMDNMTGLCRPVCAQGCVNGSCVEPDHCRCHFGFVGRNCSTECRCNRHSECAGVGARDHCLLCRNHTKELAMSEGEPKKYSLDPEEIENWVTEGPSEDEAVCVNCQNNSYGEKCDSCLQGYFLLDGKCTKCQCNGHADTCNEQDGTGCPCQNNTETGTCQGSSPSDRRDCYKYQCAKCRESFHGSPLGGQQCYRLISVEQECCLDPTSQTNCFHEPKRRALGPGRTVLFGVQPKFTNVDIRLTLDVTFGAVDLYVSTSYDTFVVRVAPDTGVHTVHIQPPPPPPPPPPPADGGPRGAGDPGGAGASSGPGAPAEPRVREVWPRGLITYVTVTEPSAVLVVRSVRDRLVITYPHEHHALKSSRFYLLLLGVGDPSGPGANGSADSQGLLFFRQDQAHIDLFVFFSVFFSCFFLFLSLCVLLWKAKQALDQRQEQRRHLQEMTKMASRPFAKVTVCFPPDPTAPAPVWKPAGLPPPAFRRSEPFLAPLLLTGAGGPWGPMGGGCCPPAIPATTAGLRAGPITLEPTEDGMAGVATLLLQLPGGPHAPNGACLGSALVTLRHRLHEYCGGSGGAGGSGHGTGVGRKGLLSQDNLTSMSL
uniref:Multiple epidermal growth factor-like domains protein 8 n=1 Tax=Nomascus leucogenys TaxID=61853 RepID=A0A2I3HUT4_NOMLE